MNQRCGTQNFGLRLIPKGSSIGVELLVSPAQKLTWRLTILHEHRLTWRGNATGSTKSAVVVRRSVPNLTGADTIEVRATQDRGPSCSVTAILPS